jgi:hypothetical protein
VAFLKKKEEGQAGHFSTLRASSNVPNYQHYHRQQISSADCCLPALPKIGRGLAIVPAIVTGGSIARIRARRLGPDTSAPNKSNNLRAAQVGMVPALLTTRNTK